MKTRVAFVHISAKHHFLLRSGRLRFAVQLFDVHGLARAIGRSGRSANVRRAGDEHIDDKGDDARRRAGVRGRLGPEQPVHQLHISHS